jgi:hypothetical protein
MVAAREVIPQSTVVEQPLHSYQALHVNRHGDDDDHQIEAIYYRTK